MSTIPPKSPIPEDSPETSKNPPKKPPLRLKSFSLKLASKTGSKVPVSPRKKSPPRRIRPKFLEDSSDEESPSPKKHSPKKVPNHSPKRPSNPSTSVQSPQKSSPKRWEGPDPKLNLQPLGLDQKLTPWIAAIRRNPIITSTKSDPSELVAQRNGLQALEVEVLDQCYSALEKIPAQVLEKFPGFDAKVFGELRILRQHLKAKGRRVSKQLETVEVLERSRGETKEDDSVTEDDFSPVRKPGRYSSSIKFNE